MKQKLWIRSVRVFDEKTGTFPPKNLMIDENGCVAFPDFLPDPSDRSHAVKDGTGLTALPAFVDLHTHLREPGFEHKETIATGTSAARAGGYRAVTAMPNTRPPIDSPERVADLIRRIQKDAVCTVFPVACITKGMEGRECADFDALHEAGAAAFSDDGRPVTDASVMREAMKRCAAKDYLILSHSEELSLSGKGVMNEGETARKLGVPGIPDSAEAVAVARELVLAGETGCRLHLCHISTEASIRLIRVAKAAGVRVTSETCPHYFSLCDEDVAKYGVNAKMSPPLRSRADVEAVREALADGTIDCIATDHAPHADSEKAVGLCAAPNGILGLQSAFPAACTFLLKPGYLSLSGLIEKMSRRPADILGFDNAIRVGQPAFLTLVDPDKTYLLTREMLKSKSGNTPFLGMPLTGAVEMTILQGEWMA